MKVYLAYLEQYHCSPADVFYYIGTYTSLDKAKQAFHDHLSQDWDGELVLTWETLHDDGQYYARTGDDELDDEEVPMIRECEVVEYGS